MKQGPEGYKLRSPLCFEVLTYLDPRRVIVPLQLLVTTKQRENVAVIIVLSPGKHKFYLTLTGRQVTVCDIKRCFNQSKCSLIMTCKGLSKHEKRLSDLNQSKMHRQIIAKGSKLLDK